MKGIFEFGFAISKRFTMKFRKIPRVLVLLFTVRATTAAGNETLKTAKNFGKALFIFKISIHFSAMPII